MKSYEKLQKVTFELRKSYEKVTRSFICRNLENGLPIRAPRQPKTKKQLRGSDRYRTSQKPFYRKNAPFARGMASHPK